jgi:hypothetical protein
LTNLPVGLLINFNVALLSDGRIKRIINGKPQATTVAPQQPLATEVGTFKAMEQQE